VYPVRGLGEFYMHDNNCDLLIVDDQQGVRMLLQEVLSEEGYKVVSATGGIEALNLISELNPRAVILDMKMPGLDGLETLKELRKKNSEVPVIMMTAYEELENRDEIRGYGVEHYLTKPFDLEDVCSLIKEIFGSTAKLGKLQEIGD